MKIAIFVFAILGAAFAQIQDPVLQPLLHPQAHHEIHSARTFLPPIIPTPRTFPPHIHPIPHTYNLPSGAELIIGDIRSTFSCYDKIYGYYADLDNNCQIYHVCVPLVDEQNHQAPLTYSFFCGNQTVFDQANLVCSDPNIAVPCSEAPTFYKVNENFGRTDRPLLHE